jgi:hypothetical protein
MIRGGGVESEVEGLSVRKRPMVDLPPYVHRVVAKGRVYYYFHARRHSKTPGPRI